MSISRAAPARASRVLVGRCIGGLLSVSGVGVWCWVPSGQAGVGSEPLDMALGRLGLGGAAGGVALDLRFHCAGLSSAEPSSRRWEKRHQEKILPGKSRPALLRK